MQGRCDEPQVADLAVTQVLDDRRGDERCQLRGFADRRIGELA
jgi:hypothetical protein